MIREHRRAVGTAIHRHVVFQQHHRPAAGASDFAGAAGQNGFLAGLALEIALEIALFDLARLRRDFFGVAAIWANQLRGRRIVIQPGPAAATRKLAARRGRLLADRRRSWSRSRRWPARRRLPCRVGGPRGRCHARALTVAATAEASSRRRLLARPGCWPPPTGSVPAATPANRD